MAVKGKKGKQGKAVSVFRLTAFGKEAVEMLDKLVQKAEAEGIDLRDPNVMEFYLSLIEPRRKKDGED